jgi:hypothetical protein
VNFRIYTDFDLDPMDRGLWAVKFEGRIVFRGSAFECARWVAQQC